MNYGFYSYSVALLAYGFFTLLLIFSWRQSRQARLLTLTMFVSTLWALFATTLAYGNTQDINWFNYQIFDIGRYVFWYVFLLKLFDPVTGQKSSEKDNDSRQARDQSVQPQQTGNTRLVRWLLPVSTGFALLVLVNEVYPLAQSNLPDYIGHIFLALTGLVILEQIFHNSSIKYRWAIKFLIVGAGSIFAFDFYIYTDGLLFRQLDPLLWQARGYIHFFAIPLLAISAARSKNWSLNLFVSRDIILTSTAIIGGGLYLILMAVAGYYLREFGGGWGRLGQITFVALALILLVSILLSGQLRASIRVFLAKHFYKNKYDYRVEWLRLTEELSAHLQREMDYCAIIQAMAQMIDARAGTVWLLEKDGQTSRYLNVAAWQSDQIIDPEPADSAFIRFLSGTRYIVNIKDIEQKQDEYTDLEMPEWIHQVNDPWVVIPLFDIDELSGFIVLAQPLVERAINWEDRDLLKTAARQVATHIKVLKTSAELAEAKQFEVFSRLSAYMVHDLKNIAAELELVASNAGRHRMNPEFLMDAFETVEHAATDIKRLLDQLRSRRANTEKKVAINPAELIEEVIVTRKAFDPQPQFHNNSAECMVAGEYAQMKNVLAHLIENAQQATDDSGEVIVDLSQDENGCVISIKDTGHGMDEAFIRERLFKPFDTTKGNAGMGIGMYESRDFIKSIGGDISVQSKPEKGSIISLHLPVIKPDRENP